MSLERAFRTPGIPSFVKDSLNRKLEEKKERIRVENSEQSFYVQSNSPLNPQQWNTLKWLLSETFEPEGFSTSSSFLGGEGNGNTILEVGPRMSFTTAWSTNAVAICKACGLKEITRIERSTRFSLKSTDGNGIDSKDLEFFLEQVHDRMTEMRYENPLKNFDSGMSPQPVQSIQLLERGKEALLEINDEMGLAFDEQDLELYLNLFKGLNRNPTNVELFDLAQSNSEHSRHWYFRGRIVIDGKEQEESLMSVVKSTLKEDTNSVIAFCDNSSAIRGFKVETILPQEPGKPCKFDKKEVDYDLLFTAETHNFPTGVAPKPGAETGTGGRIRDTHATGRGSLVVAGTACYCVGNLQVPSYSLPWEDSTFDYPKNLASPLHIEIEASNGASEYGNKFGEPVIQGYSRSFGLKLPNGERREWIKPIMFTGGVGQLSHSHLEKGSPKIGMLVTKIGGPAYRIGMGGGSASSLVGGANASHLDFNAVQRGDAEMGQKLNRVVKACVELGGANPIISIHDQGAGGSANVLKEIVDPMGAKLDIRKVIVGDDSLSVLEIWGAEYQEQDALLIEEKSRELFQSICEREHLPVAFLGQVTGDGRIVLEDSRDNTTPVDLPLEKVLGKMPAKVFPSQHVPKTLKELELPKDLSVENALERVLRLMSVGSKSFLTNKVDRCVTGLIAQQQSVGPLHLPLSDVAVIAQSHFGTTGAAISIGEQPIKGLLDPKAMARMTVGESITNLVWAQVTKLEDVKTSGNWMWAAKLPGEGAELWDAAVAMRDIMCELGIAIDGGKDSLSMAAKVPGRGENLAETVKSPGTLVISSYVSCPDIRKTVTPDLKFAGKSSILFVDLGNGRKRMGGSSLAHVYSQIGNESPDVDDPKSLKDAFYAVQRLISEGLISAGHDRSDGGLITTVLEMAFGGNSGLDLNLELASDSQLIPELFNEELGLVMEVKDSQLDKVLSIFKESGLKVLNLGRTTVERTVKVTMETPEGKKIVLQNSTEKLREIWNDTSYHLELLQANPSCVEQEKVALSTRKGMSFSPSLSTYNLPSKVDRPLSNGKHRIAIIREEGSNGDREMTSAFFCAGFEAWDVNMSDLSSGKVNLDGFRGVAFVGGFSYADVLDSAKGWAGVIRFDVRLVNQFQNFRKRPDTFSLGICNGCQLMALLGWVPFEDLKEEKDQPRFIDNVSGRFESRFLTVKVQKSPSVLLKGMEGSTIGVWSSHGSGHAHIQPKILERILSNDLAPVRYVDDDHNVTESYPFNPNGSPQGIAGLTSLDGRHLCMMPHPERSFIKWQYPFLPIDWQQDPSAYTPWMRMFYNAYQFCEETKSQ